jgi:hypothetical protein
VIWKTITGIISNKIYEHLEINHLIPDEQKGCIRNSNATKSQLIADKEIMDEAKTKKKNLSMCWIDFRKAYDMVPHKWIIETLKIYGVADNIITFITSSMQTWNVHLYHDKSHICNIPIRRGIFQGDSLSPLLFIITLFPLSHILRNSLSGYRKSNDPPKSINHLLYMDDIKLFARNAKELKLLISEVKRYSDQMKMSFGIEKCKIVHIKHGELDRTSDEGYKINHDEIIKTLRQDQDAYKYLGILELTQIKHTEMKTQIRTEYVKRIKNILSSELSGRNKIISINTLAVPVVRYSAGIIKWTRHEIQELDRKTRKLLTIHRGFAMRADVDRLYAKRKDGGRGLLSIEEIVKVEEMRMKHESHVREETSNKMEQTMRQKRKDEWVKKPMHGQYIRQLEDNIDQSLTFRWLIKGNMSIESEGLITAAQDQAIQTRAISCIYHLSQNDKCRLCGTAPETPLHILAECTKLAQTDYLERHNQVGKYIHWRLLQIHGINREEIKWHLHTPDRVVENNSVKILWDFNIYTDKIITARRPDIVVINKTLKTGLIIDINCPNDRNACRNEKGKIIKYTDLKIELERIWNIHFDVVPIVIGCLGAIPRSLTKFIKKIGLDTQEIDSLQHITLYSSCHILRRYVTQSAITQNDN